MNRSVLAIMLFLSALSSLGQQAETKRTLFIGKLTEIQKAEPLIDSLLSYPGNSVEMNSYDLMELNVMILKREDFKTYSLNQSYADGNNSMEILRKKYELALSHAQRASLSHKKFAASILEGIEFNLKEKYKQIEEEKRNTKKATAQKQQLVELAHHCQDAYFRYCFRYLVNDASFALYWPFVDSSLVEQLRYSLKHPYRTADEVAIAVQCRDENLYFVEDTLRCPLLPDSRLCRDLEYLKWKSKEKKVSVDSLIARKNREERIIARLYAEKLDNSGYQQHDLRLKVLKMLDETPIMALAGEVERYGKSYEKLDVNWMYTLAQLRYKDYADRYVNSIDSLLKRDESMEDQQWRYGKARNILAKLIKIGRTDGVTQFAPLLLSKSIIEGSFFRTRMDFQAFLILRFYLPELYSYGQERFVAHCRTNLIGFKYESLLQEEKVPIALKPSRDARKFAYSCDEVYRFGGDRDYMIYPEGFFEEMYEWMVRHKGKFIMRNSSKMFYNY